MGERKIKNEVTQTVVNTLTPEKKQHLRDIGWTEEEITTLEQEKGTVSETPKSKINEILIERERIKDNLLIHFDLEGLKKELERKENVLLNLQGQDLDLKAGLTGQISIIKDVISELEGEKTKENKTIVKKVFTPEFITTQPKTEAINQNIIAPEKEKRLLNASQTNEDIPEIDLLQHISGGKKNREWKILQI